MRKIFETIKRFHGYKTQYDYYRTSGVMYKYFSNDVFNVHDKINYRSMHLNSCLIIS
jgi:hypothetical protein